MFSSGSAFKLQQHQLLSTDESTGSTGSATWLSNRDLYLIPCGKKKKIESSRAEDMYTSARFSNQISFIKAIGAEFFIASAKHGLLSRDQIVEPYDYTLDQMDSAGTVQWANSVWKKIYEFSDENQRIIVMPAEGYELEIAKILNNNNNMQREVLIAQDRVSMFSETKTEKIIQSRNRIKDLYGNLYAETGMGEVRKFADLKDIKIPSQGVYLFFDELQKSAIFPAFPKIVRVGTHGVSAGSKATLRQRLRTHFGAGNGGGNHRSSVFRLHIGECMIRKHGMKSDFPFWGGAQPDDHNSQSDERDLECQVSKYIRDLLFVSIPVAGLSAKDNSRSKLERELIQLFTADNIALDQAGRDWLGHFSSRKQIRNSGLWNVQHSGFESAKMKELEPIQYTLFE